MTFNRRMPRARNLWTPKPIGEDYQFKTSWFQPSQDTLREQENLLAHMYFLVLQGDEFGERLRCVRCGTRHKYITLNCIERPITGLAGGLYAYYRAVRDNTAPNTLKPAHQERLIQIKQVLDAIPDLSISHPLLARKMFKDVGPSDLQLGAVALGILEGISPTDAKRLVVKINERGLERPYTLSVSEQTRQAEIDRALEYRGAQFTRSRW